MVRPIKKNAVLEKEILASLLKLKKAGKKQVTQSINKISYGHF
jgi:hypothetical protein